MVIAAIIVDGLFSGAGLIPHVRPARSSIFQSIKVDYKLFTNVAALAVFAALFLLTVRRGATDPVCGMKADKAKALRADFAGHTYYFCSQACQRAFEANPAHYLDGRAIPPEVQAAAQ